MEQRDVQEYLIPKTLAEALSILEKEERKLCIVAGATDVYVGDSNNVKVYLDITRTGLSYIKKEEGKLIIGACTTFDEIVKSELIKKEAMALWQAAGCLADKTIRNVATVGGNIVTAVPSGDAIAPLIALDAVFVLISADGERKVGAEEFYLGVRKTRLEEKEILKEIIIPAKAPCQQSVFMKQGRNSEDIAIINVAVCLTVDEADRITNLRIANGAVAPTAVRAHALEQKLTGQKVTEENIEKNLELLEQSISPITNVRGTAEYRMEISKVFTRRAIMKAFLMIKES